MAVYKPRQWPLLIVTKSNTVHISPGNVGSLVRTECGRDMQFRWVFRGTPEDIRSEKKRIISFKDKPYMDENKLCRHCGSVQDFIDAWETYLKLHSEQMERMKKKEEFIRETIARESKELTDDLVAAIEGVGSIKDITAEGTDVRFRMELPDGNSMLMRLAPDDYENACYLENIRLRAMDEFEEMNKNQ